MIEFLYLASQIQCGANGEFLNINVDIYQNQELIQTLEVGEKALLPVSSINDVTFQYSAVNNTTGCALSAPSKSVLAADDQVPNIPGVYQQNSIKELLDGLKDYEKLFLVELGTTDQNSDAFDLQDVVGIVNNDPKIATIFPD